MSARSDRRLMPRYAIAPLVGIALWSFSCVGLQAQGANPSAPAATTSTPAASTPTTSSPTTSTSATSTPAASTPPSAASTPNTGASPNDAAQPKATPAPATPAPADKSPAPSAATPASPPSASKPTPGTQSPQPTPVPKTPGAKPEAVQPNQPQPGNAEGENGAPGLLDSSAMENVQVPARPVVELKGTSSYDDAFKSIKESLDKVKAAMAKAGLKPSGHPITIFSEPDEKGFKYEAAIPVATKPDKTDLGDGVTVGMSPAGKAIKFQHRADYDSIDSTYDAIAAYLDAKGILASNPYVEEYLTDLTTSDDPNLQVDIYVLIK